MEDNIPEEIRRLPSKWRQLESGHGVYAVAARKVANHCADELERAIARAYGKSIHGGK